jgi:ATP-binding cassette subfamily A (ABC1) protein 3
LSWKYASDIPPHLPSMSGVIGMLFVDALLYLLIAWYLNNVLSGEYGVAKPWNFCFKLSYWGFKKPEQEVTRFILKIF